MNRFTIILHLYFGQKHPHNTLEVTVIVSSFGADFERNLLVLQALFFNCCQFIIESSGKPNDNDILSLPRRTSQNGHHLLIN